VNSIKIALLTIGQSPRRDIIPEIRPLISPDIEIKERGLLDNLNFEEIQKLKPQKDEVPLVSILKNGETVHLEVKKIETLLEENIKEMQKENIKAVGLLCTHDFQEKKYSIPVIFPSKVIKFLIEQILGINKLGVVIPLENQLDMVKGKFQCKKIFIQVKSPYGKGKSWKEVAYYFKEEGVEGVVLDCIGYKIKDKQEIKNLVEIPVILPRLILAHSINFLFS